MALHNSKEMYKYLVKYSPAGSVCEYIDMHIEVQELRRDVDIDVIIP